MTSAETNHRLRVLSDALARQAKRPTPQKPGKDDLWATVLSIQLGPPITLTINESGAQLPSMPSTTAASGTGTVTSLSVSALTVPVAVGTGLKIAGDTNSPPIVFSVTSAGSVGDTALNVTAPPITTTIAAGQITGLAPTTQIRFLSSYEPTIGDTIVCERVGADLVVIGGLKTQVTAAAFFDLSMGGQSGNYGYGELSQIGGHSSFPYDPVAKTGKAAMSFTVPMYTCASASMIFAFVQVAGSNVDTSNGTYTLGCFLSVSNVDGSEYISLYGSHIMPVVGPGQTGILSPSEVSVYHIHGSDLSYDASTGVVGSTAGGSFAVTIDVTGNF